MDQEGGVPPCPAGVYWGAHVRHQLVLARVGEQGGHPVLGADVGRDPVWLWVPADLHGSGVFSPPPMLQTLMYLRCG